MRQTLRYELTRDPQDALRASVAFPTPLAGGSVASSPFPRTEDCQFTSGGLQARRSADPATDAGTTRAVLSFRDSEPGGSMSNPGGRQALCRRCLLNPVTLLWVGSHFHVCLYPTATRMSAGSNDCAFT